MNEHQVGGRGKQLRGTVKDAIGRATGDRGLQGNGKLDKGVGKLQKKLGDAGAKLGADQPRTARASTASRSSTTRTRTPR